VEFDAVTFALAFAADRADHILNRYNGVAALLESGSWVLCDRYLLSSLAYQSGEHTNPEWLRVINQHAIPPDITVFIDVAPEVCFARLTARSSLPERFHDEAELTRIWENYRRLASQGGFGHLVWIDGESDQATVFGGILKALRPLLAEHLPGLDLDKEDVLKQANAS
jgi:dTMP kinase